MIPSMGLVRMEDEGDLHSDLTWGSERLCWTFGVCILFQATIARRVLLDKVAEDIHLLFLAEFSPREQQTA